MIPALVVLALLQANVATEPTAPPHVVTNPSWVRRPDGNDMALAYPTAAAVARISGGANLDCGIDEKGYLTNCVAENANPPGMGFDRAALALVKRFRMKPMTVDGRPVAGGHIHIPIIFRMPY